MQTDKGVVPATALVQELRREKVVLPPINVIERVCALAITRANRKIYLILAGGLNDGHRVLLEGLLILVGMLHRDKKVWGEDPEAFDPDRFSPGKRANIPPNAYKPFGTGQRACIGRQFALQEAALVLSMLLQRFEFVDFANYQLETKQALTIKPNNFHIKVRLRAGRTATAPLTGSPLAAVTSQPAAAPTPTAEAHQMPLLVLYGSNLGTAERLAHTIAEDATNRGFLATVGSLDDHVGSLPKEGGLIVVTASYNGQPPDNAANAVLWLP